MDMLDGDEDLWHHLHAMERGDRGGFMQRLFLAMEKLDELFNQQEA